MATSPIYISAEGFREKDQDTQVGLPLISQGLDSVRTYQFEMHFDNVPGGILDGNAELTDLVLACKQVSQVGFSIEPIEVHRVNDKVFYPGKASPEELTVTFDNFYANKTGVAQALYRWYQSIYNPVTGRFLTEPGNTGGGTAPRTSDFKCGATLYHLDPQGSPIAETKLIGLMPISWKTAEFNYSTNEFHTIEMGFRYDFLQHKGMAG